MFADRVKNLSASGIRKVFDLGASLEDPINFSIGQPNFDVPDKIKLAAINAISEGHNSYTVTQGIPELRENIKNKITETRKVCPEECFVTSGVSGGILLSFLVLINPGDEVIIPDPYFVMYKNLVELAGGIPKYYDLYPDFQLKAQKIEELISEKTKIILVNSPSNPTGVLFNEKDLKEVADIARKNNIIVISDEIYSSFLYEGNYHSIFSYYPEKTILLDGFSKSYAMTGWRMGYAAGSKELMEKMITLQQFSFVCAPSLAQHACNSAFDVDITPHINDYRRKRDMIYEGLKSKGFSVEKPNGSFYIFPQVPWGTASEFCEAAIAKNMLIIPGKAFSNRDTHFRISFAVSDEKIKEGLEALGDLANRK
ncbi:pyridoxal phosphate-dependent aminotransferase [Candidatus Uabimicrobium sp. HlEnr_7]|uniref:pyridoxal phosphate-dependent aminotransferase n=1 Tax=Candidatus Uabimicrobium helgolandensis TaxID=3095367 RepID=UPI003557FBB0